MVFNLEEKRRPAFFLGEGEEEKIFYLLMLFFPTKKRRERLQGLFLPLASREVKGGRVSSFLTRTKKKGGSTGC